MASFRYNQGNGDRSLDRRALVRLASNRRDHKSEGGISALVRRHLLEHGVADTRREAIRELARLARNFNSIAAAAENYDPSRAVEITAWLVVIEREIRGAVQRLSTKRPV